MADRRQLEILKSGPQVWNEFRERNPDLVPDLVEADLRGADLTGVNFKRANLRRARLDRANLTRAKLGGVNLRSANLPETNLRGADLGAATLRQANLVGANLGAAILMDADLTGADLTEADLTKADLIWAVFSTALLGRTNFDQSHLHRTVFADVDLSVAKGLETTTHEGPTTIGIDTIYRSGGNIPEVFLRGCGVPDDFVTYAKSLVGKPIEFYSCFISYSTLDQEFADRLYADLQAKGVRCWFAPHNLQGGRKMHEQIDEAIRLYDKLLLILSERSMDSEWVKTEISIARKREAREGRRMLFPIRLVGWKRISEWECFDADRGKDSAREIREFYVPDFSLWKTDHDTYKKEFGSLLRDLNPKAAPAVR
jgi:uncharacterized protein YjbI with pentapeptide repeats